MSNNTKKPFAIQTSYSPAGDQPAAIKQLIEGLQAGEYHQTLLGVTGSGKTFTTANVIEHVQRPTLVLAPNKTLAAQLYAEMQDFFPKNSVEYFVSYYDYYQPEAYVVTSDTYIEKDASINEQIEQMRLSATKALFERRDVVIVATVSAIYGLGDPQSYISMVLILKVGASYEQRYILRRLAELQYTRNDVDFKRSTYRVRGDVIDVFPAEAEDHAIRIEMFGDEVEKLRIFDPLTGEVLESLSQATIYPKSHYVTPRQKLLDAMEFVKEELKTRLLEFNGQQKLVEAQRLEQRTLFDIEMIQELGYCSGIENYSRYLSGRGEGEPPPTLMDYLPDDALLIIDESHVTVPQIRGMYRGDRARKENLVNYGFRLPSALDNRPLMFEEFEKIQPQTIYISATPGPYELERTDVCVEQVVRPTGLLDPEIIVRPVNIQVDDLLSEIKARQKVGERVLITTLTKKMSENLTDYYCQQGIKAKYLHSDIGTVERVEIIHSLRAGECDCLIGINLLREGLDIPEVSLVAILDADKEGFLRSERSLIQTIGRAARNSKGIAILYADKVTGSMQTAISETKRRREKQVAYNTKHDITPQTISKPLKQILENVYVPQKRKSRKGVEKEESIALNLSPKDILKTIDSLEKEMHEAAKNLEFEKAADLRDKVKKLKKNLKITG